MKPKIKPKVLFVMTSCSQLGDSSWGTGAWFETIATPYEILTGRHIEVVFATPEGGEVPVDPDSRLPQYLTYYTEKFDLNDRAQRALQRTNRLEEMKPEDFDAVLFPGGHGVLFDLVSNPTSIRFIETIIDLGKPLALIGHAVGALRYVQKRSGESFVEGKKVTGFSNSEEAALALLRMLGFVPYRFLRFGNFLTYLISFLPSPEYATLLRLRGSVPFLVERMLKRSGADYVHKKNWYPFMVEDLTEDGGHLLTGQNPASAALVADRLAEILT
ncbi:type 1 glutamine amidotransferase domain-containing protein [Acetobacteraceae bacterium]|nr:type 1 glutamine amidotransferase domain-containing protein [Acetobacteraceae bacterium]